MNQTLESILSYEKAYRSHRLAAANWVLQHTETFPELLQYCFANDPIISHKANWVLEFVCLDSLDLLYPQLDFFFKKISTVKTDSSVRPLAHICELLILQYYKKKDTILLKMFTEVHKEQLASCCFDWLITDQKVACQVRAMTCLYYLGTESDWIHPELQTILASKISVGSAGYQSRGKKTLKLIQDFKKSH